MLRPWAEILAGVLSVATMAEAQPSPNTMKAGWWSAAPTSAKRRYLVAAMGDSLTDPRSHGGKYLDYLAKQCPESRFDSYGVGGHMVNQMRKRFARDVLGKDGDRTMPKPSYTHVIILGGINDICSDEKAHRTNDKIEADLAAMYRMARERGIEIVALTLPPWAGFTRYYNPRRRASTQRINGWIKEQAEDDLVNVVLDIYPLLSCGDAEHLCDAYGWPDHVHWSAKGHEIVGKALHAEVFADCE